MAMVFSRMHQLTWLLAIASIITTVTCKGVAKTIQSYETGEVIDCVNIRKQPAFDHPLLKNHAIQMEPSSNMKANGAGNVEGPLRQAWWKYGECPEGTIPITRPQNHTNPHANVKWLNLSGNGPNASELNRFFEFAAVDLPSGKHTGAQAKINVWNPMVLEQEASFSQIWIAAGPLENLNVVEAGLMVSTTSEPRHRAKIIIYWTKDNFQKTGCYNLECSGFVQTSSKISLGAVVDPVSNYGGPQYDISIDISRDQSTGWWWLAIANNVVGYWPREIFTALKEPADLVRWGGLVFNRAMGGNHTSTQMGSGHFPSEGFGKAAYFRNLQFEDDQHVKREPENLNMKVSRPECYDLRVNLDPPGIAGVNFYYGGPGFSAQCG